jgi:hypothetical protein
MSRPTSITPPLGDITPEKVADEKQSVDDVEEKVEHALFNNADELSYSPGEEAQDKGSSERIIRDGVDVSEHLLPTRDDGDPSLTFRSVTLGLIGGAFNATMFQIYQVSRSTYRY